MIILRQKEFVFGATSAISNWKPQSVMGKIGKAGAWTANKTANLAVGTAALGTAAVAGTGAWLAHTPKDKD